MRTFYILLIQFVVLISANAQDVSGHWTGIHDQRGKEIKYNFEDGQYLNSYGLIPLFTFEMDINQDGNLVTGIYTVRSTKNFQSYIRVVFSGRFTGKYLRFKGHEVLEKGGNEDWCIITSELKFIEKEGIYFLKGSNESQINGVPCVPGIIYISRNAKIKTSNIRVKDREIEVQDSIIVRSSEITIEVWDEETIDRDSISINFNGKWVLKNYELKKNKKIIKINLENYDNYLMIYALNLGQIKPNTAAVLISDGNKEKLITLKSDFSKNGTILVKYLP